MERITNHYDIVCKLIGDINPVGESNEDSKRLENIRDEIELTDRLVDDIIFAARCKFNHQGSMKIIGQEADKFITRLREKFDCK